MQAIQLLEQSRSPTAWRKHSKALRRSAHVLWEDFEGLVIAAAKEGANNGTEPDFTEAIEALETTKLLYGLALETALKAWIVQRTPDVVELRITMDGRGEAMQAELRSFGVPVSQGHNLLALAEVAGLFGPDFSAILKTSADHDAMRNICRDLGEVVVWRGRYPIPLASFEPVKLNPAVPAAALVHYMRDWLDPVLNALHESD